MKNYFTLLLALLANLAFSQSDYYWVGGNAAAGASWNDANNWANVPGGLGGAGVPSLPDNIYITSAAAISLTSDGTFEVKGCQVSANLTLVNGSATNYAFKVADGVVTGGTGLIVDAGKTLETKPTSTGDVNISVGNGGIINGTVFMNGKGQFAAGNVGALDINGTLTHSVTATDPYLAGSDPSLVITFRNGSVFELKRAYAWMRNMGKAVFEPNSTVKVTNATAFDAAEYGNIEFTNGSGGNLFGDFNTTGSPVGSIVCNNLKIVTSGGNLNVTDKGPIAGGYKIHVKGNLDIQADMEFWMGNTGALGNGFATFTVDGDFKISGGKRINLQSSVIEVKGNIDITGAINNGYTRGLKMIGTSPQSIKINSGTGLSTSNYMNFTINNPTGVSLLSNVALQNGNVELANGSTLSLGNFNLSTGGYIAQTGSPTTGHILTNGTGSITVSAIPTGGKYIHVGANATSTDPVEVKPTTANASATVKVSSTITNSPADPSRLYPRQWDISVTSPATLTFNPDAASAPTVPVVNPVIGHFTGGVWTEKVSTATAPVFSAAFTSYSTFVVGEAGGVLPIELMSFEATKNEYINKLTWATASERNALAFEIERLEGQSWVKLGSVKAKGNSADVQKYAFNDASPLSLSYYRLRLIDNDGKAEYSKIASVMRQDKGKIKVYPTIVFNSLTVECGSSEKSMLTVVNINGVSVLNKNIEKDGTLTTLDVTALPKGYYFLKHENVEGVETVRFIKQ